MIILGLGSNLGDRLHNLRSAFHAIKQLEGIQIKQVSPVYLSDALLPDNAPHTWNKSYLNLALRCEAALDAFTLLKKIKQIEQTLGRQRDAQKWSPRLIDIDILAWGEQVIETEHLCVPQKQLHERPFALWPLADVAPFWTFPRQVIQGGKTAAESVAAWGSRFSGDAPFHTRQINQRIDTSQLVGIINVTPDSFSDGGQCFDADTALQQAMQLSLAGAEIIDIGAESTAPHAKALTPEIEWQRLEPVLNALCHARSHFLVPPKISVDTRHAAVAKQALAYGIDWINDVSGLRGPAMCEIIAAAKVDCVMMHHLSLPADAKHILPPATDGVKAVYEWGEQQLEKLQRAGIAKERVIFDPGIGFGKTPAQSLALIKQIHVFTQLGTRLLVGHSRKSFLSAITSASVQSRDLETSVMGAYLTKHHVDYLRVHNVEMSARALKMIRALD